MGLFSKYVISKLAESMLEKVGEVTVKTTVGIMEGKAKSEAKSSKQKMDVNNKPANATKKTEKYNVTKQEDNRIKCPKFENLIGEHYLKVRAAFVGAGFEDLSYIVKKDIIKGWLKKDGEVSEISINGRTEVSSRAKFKPTDPVVIVYHTYKDGIMKG